MFCVNPFWTSFHKIPCVVCKSCFTHCFTKYFLLCTKAVVYILYEIPYMLCTKAVAYIAPQNSSYVEHESSCVYCSTKILIRSVRKLFCTLFHEILYMLCSKAVVYIDLLDSIIFFGEKSSHFKSIKLILYLC